MEITPVQSFKRFTSFTSSCLGTRITSVFSSSSISTCSLMFFPFSTTLKAYFSTCNKRTKINRGPIAEKNFKWNLRCLFYLFIRIKNNSSSWQKRINILNVFLSSTFADHTNEFLSLLTWPVADTNPTPQKCQQHLKINNLHFRLGG